MCTVLVVAVCRGVLCSASYPTTSRICHCVKPEALSKVGALGTGCSQCTLSPNETTFFSHVLPAGATGMMNHFWVTAKQADLADAVYNYYIDGESSPSISFTPGMACGVGFNDAQAPWGIINLRVPQIKLVFFITTRMLKVKSTYF